MSRRVTITFDVPEDADARATVEALFHPDVWAALGEHADLDALGPRPDDNAKVRMEAFSITMV